MVNNEYLWKTRIELIQFQTINNLQICDLRRKETNYFLIDLKPNFGDISDLNKIVMFCFGFFLWKLLPFDSFVIEKL